MGILSVNYEAAEQFAAIENGTYELISWIFVLKSVMIINKNSVTI